MIAYLSQIVEWPGNNIIHANNIIIWTLQENVNAKVITDETCASGYNDGFLHLYVYYLHSVIIIYIVYNWYSYTRQING